MNHQLTINKFLFTLAVQRKYFIYQQQHNSNQNSFHILLLFRLGGIDIIIGFSVFIFFFYYFLKTSRVSVMCMKF